MPLFPSSRFYATIYYWPYVTRDYRSIFFNPVFSREGRYCCCPVVWNYLLCVVWNTRCFQSRKKVWGRQCSVPRFLVMCTTILSAVCVSRTISAPNAIKLTRHFSTPLAATLLFASATFFKLRRQLCTPAVLLLYYCTTAGFSEDTRTNSWRWSVFQERQGGWAAWQHLPQHVLTVGVSVRLGRDQCWFRPNNID